MKVRSRPTNHHSSFLPSLVFHHFVLLSLSLFSYICFNCLLYSCLTLVNFLPPIPVRKPPRIPPGINFSPIEKPRNPEIRIKKLRNPNLKKISIGSNVYCVKNTCKCMTSIHWLMEHSSFPLVNIHPMDQVYQSFSSHPFFPPCLSCPTTTMSNRPNQVNHRSQRMDKVTRTMVETRTVQVKNRDRIQNRVHHRNMAKIRTETILTIVLTIVLTTILTTILTEPEKGTNSTFKQYACLV